MKRRHPVVFVGAGPGDPELITVKGQRALAGADLILYAGSLVSEAVLAWARPGTTLVDTAPLELDAILQRLIRGHREGNRVVRLHSGDISLFSAIQEQIDGLEGEGIPYTLIPGVTAASAASAAIAREFTIPEVTQTVILTRAAGRTPVPEREAISRLAQHGSSMAIYLSVQRIDEVAKALEGAYGADAEVVVAYRVSWPQQRIIRGTLATIAGQVREAGIERHALILVGPAAARRGSRPETRSRLYDGAFSHGYRGRSKD
jgi:precorrin-4/cobalt-precorrin-4 C11-methyltransferase